MSPLAPILIASPARRSGTTLLQRLLSSSDNALIYGETCANDLFLFSNLILTKRSFFNSGKNWRNEQLKSVLKGEVNNWIPDLIPDVDEYLDSYENSLFSLLRYFESFAVKNKRHNWGVKLPEWHPVNLKQLHDLLPACKIIYIKRNLEDCLKSAKGAEILPTLSHVEEFCQVWKQYIDYAETYLKGERILHIRYEELISGPSAVLAQIETHTGIKGIDPAVLNYKVNTYKGEYGYGKNDEYVHPLGLANEEIEIMNRTLEKGNYQVPGFASV